MNLLGPTFLVVIVILVMLGGALTMFLAMRTSVRRGRAERDRRQAVPQERPPTDH